MKNIRFYEAEKYHSPDYEKVEDMIYKTIEENSGDTGFLALGQCMDKELVEKLLKSENWTEGTGKFLEKYLILIYEGERYCRKKERIGTEQDVVYKDMNYSPSNNIIYVTSIVFEPEPEFGENEPDDECVSQYPLEDILDEFDIYSYDSYDAENASDKKNSYVEFAADDIEDIRKILTLHGKHVYNKVVGEYEELFIE